MPRQRKRVTFQQLEFEQEIIIGFYEGGTIAARVQRDSSTVMRVWNE